MTKSDEDGKVHVRLTSKELEDGILLANGRSYILQIHTKKPILRIALEIDPNVGSTMDDKYTLLSTDRDQKYSKTLTVMDDKIDGDSIITLEFEDIHTDLRYTLEIDTGAEGDSYVVFEDIPYVELSD